MATQAEISSQIRAALALVEPDLDTNVGSTMRKIIDVFSEVVAERDMDSYVAEYAYDIDSKSGADLDEMLRLFGFSRYPARRAVGELTFGRSTSSNVPVSIPAGTIAVAESGVLAMSAVGAVLTPGDLQITVPAYASEPGTSGNVPAGSYLVLRNPVPGITAVNNLAAFTGGTDIEDDESFRERFRRTVFRNMAGTEQMFTAVALNDVDVSHANVVGAFRRFRERLDLVGGTATSTVQDAKLISQDSVIFGPSIDEGKILAKDATYSFNSSVIPPKVNSLDPQVAPNGIYDLEFSYTPKMSRNDPNNGITNRIDIYVKGERAVEATETLVIKTSRVFNSTAGSPYNRLNFHRRDESNPQAGNFFVPYSLAPVLDPSTSDTITINAVTYQEGVHYHLVNDITERGGAPRSLSGIEIVSSANGSNLANPPNDSRTAVTYSFNEVPRSIEEAIDNWRLVGTDVWVHQASPLRLRLHFAVMLDPGYTADAVRLEMIDTISKLIDRIGFRSVLQASDLLAAAHNVAGVDAIRFMTSSDNSTNFAIQRVTIDGDVKHIYASTSSPRRAIDVYCGDSEVPILDDITLTVRAQNTFGSV